LNSNENSQLNLVSIFSNLATLITFSNTLDESWFYLVTTAIEGFGGRALTSIMAAIQATYDGNNEILINELRNISSTIFDINKTLQKMFKKCDPYVFYWKVRPYLSGWENEDRLPQGLIYEGVDGNDENGNPIYRRYIGGSAGQSALIQALDIALSVKHYPTGIKPHANSSCHCYNGHNEPQQPYLHRIRQNIPGPHRRFLEDLAKIADIRNYIISTTDYDSSVNTSSSDESEDTCLLSETDEANDLIKAYNECLNQMKDFRKTHLNIVNFYIIKQARRGGDSHFNAKEVTPPVDKGNIFILFVFIHYSFERETYKYIYLFT
jgi:indoleamine 2,3-dioxygenase